MTSSLYYHNEISKIFKKKIITGVLKELMANEKSGNETVIISINSILRLHVRDQEMPIVIERASFSRVRSHDKSNLAKFYRFRIMRRDSFST